MNEPSEFQSSVSVVVKTEVPDCPVDEKDVDDEFIKRYIDRENEDEEDNKKTLKIYINRRDASTGGDSNHNKNYSAPQTRASARTMRACRVAKLTKMEEEDEGLEADDDVEDWSPKKSRKSGSTSRASKSRKSGSASRKSRSTSRASKSIEKTGGARPRMSSEERKRRSRERMKELRKRRAELERKFLEGNGDCTNVKVEPGGEEEDVATTPDEGDRQQLKRLNVRQTSARELERRKRLRELAKKGLLPEDKVRAIEIQRERDRERKRAKRAAAAASRTSKQTCEEETKVKPDEDDLQEVKRLREQRAAELERRKELRRLANAGALPEDKARAIEIQRERDRERRRAKRAAMTPEQKREEYQRNYMYLLSKRASLSEDAKRELRMKEYMQKQAKLAEETSEKREQRLAKKRERGRLYAREKAAAMDASDWEKRRERKRQRWHSMDPETKSRTLAKFREWRRNHIQKLKEDPEKWEMVRQKWAERDKIKYLKRREAIAMGRRKKPVTTKKGKETESRSNWTKEQKLERQRQCTRLAALKKKLAIQKLMTEKGMTMEQIQQLTDTREQRERRCIQARIRKARNNLRARLQFTGAPPEEIQKREQQLEQTYQPSNEFQPYKHRPSTWKPITPSEIAELSAKGVLEDLDRIDPLDLLLPKKRSKSSPLKSTSNATTCADEQQSGTSPPPAISSKNSKQPRRRQRQKYPSQIPNLPSSHHQSASESMHNSVPQILQNSHFSQYQHNSVYQPAAAVQYTLQQPQPIYTLQNMTGDSNDDDGSLDHSSISNVMNSSTQQATYDEYNKTVNSSDQLEYINCYNDDDNDNASYSSHPSSPAEREGNDDDNYHQSKPATYPSTMVNVKKKKVYKKPYRYRPSKNPNAKLRGQRLEAVKDQICDECGQYFTRKALAQHKRQFHNSNWDGKKCVVCGEGFKNARVWYSHYYNVHDKPDKVLTQEKAYICDLCGQGFGSNDYLRKHQHLQHSAEGKKPENQVKCPVCPDERRFLHKSNFVDHMKKFHPNHEIPTHRCYRCDKSWTSTLSLREHVQTAHPQSYFPCPSCDGVRYTEMGLCAHLKHGQCSTRQSERKNELKNSPFCVRKVFLACELCDKTVKLTSLKSHYRDMHNAKEDKFKCSLCEKDFKDREFWTVHMEEIHERPMDEIKDLVRKLNLANRKEISVKPLTRRKPGRAQRNKKTSTAKKRKKARGIGRDCDSDDDDEQSDDCLSEDSVEAEKPGKLVRKRRNIRVIADEDEEDYSIM